MKHNLIPPFIMQEAGLVSNDATRRHLGEGMMHESHSIFVSEHELVTPLRLKGIFSGFPTRKMTKNEMVTCNDMNLIHLTPDGQAWYPHY